MLSWRDVEDARIVFGGSEILACAMEISEAEVMYQGINKVVSKFSGHSDVESCFEPDNRTTQGIPKTTICSSSCAACGST